MLPLACGGTAVVLHRDLCYMEATFRCIVCVCLLDLNVLVSGVSFVKINTIMRILLYYRYQRVSGCVCYLCLLLNQSIKSNCEDLPLQ